MSPNWVDPTYGTTEEHLAFCKTRALEYVEIGDLDQALTSLNSDLSKHPGTADNPAISLGLQLVMLGELNTPAKMRKWIEGF